MRINSTVTAPAPAVTPKTSALRYERVKDTVQFSANVGLGSTAGYGAGAVVGAVAHDMGASSAYSHFAPAAAAALGGLWCVAGQTGNAAVQRTAMAATLASLGSVVGDAVGHGLSHVSGLPIYAAIGPAVGAFNGAALSTANWGLKSCPAFDRWDCDLLPATLGLTGGGAAGCLAGALIAHVTGNPIYQKVAPILGAVAGGLSGAAVSARWREGA